MTKRPAIRANLRKACLRPCRSIRDLFAHHEEGASLVEYALLVGLLALATVAALQFLSNTFSNAFNSIGNTISNHSQPS